ncbi:hypothetical protein LOTGIDRAFT_121560 [Lottia gigantea]|uniref:Integrin alpha FG-GAP repeat containing 2 n=1 Tax=Lottia gigantea TaxID=225164 RepID=V4AAH9_LOTGI|nr:hypothetical protein LOTGIDRAFT_121560 [Lottia gigantea]ESO92085.1 hypothetical protein LOTGIDRAFT_121560 [Lottia gigantea]
MWRTVSFVDRIEVEFKGTLFNQAVALADVDNDQARDCAGLYNNNKNELIVGNVDGDLAIFKGSNPTSCKKSSDLGMITCLGVGDVCNQNKNVLVTLTAEGWCYLFGVKAEGETPLTDEDKTLKPAYKQDLPANGKVLLIADADTDGKIELIVGYSDRVVRSFRWQPGSNTSDIDYYSTGHLVSVQKWQLAGQTESITMNRSLNGEPQLMASQPGGTLVILLPHNKGNNHQPLKSKSSNSNVDSTKDGKSVRLSRAKNRDMSTVMVGNITPGVSSDDAVNDSCQTYYAVATLDGNLVLAENDKILWSLQVDHQLFSLCKLDVTGNGQEEVVCCSWDGQTYIVNQSREVVRYLFQEHVAAFSAGFYSLGDGGNRPCFVYATFDNTLYIYHNINLPRVESTNLIQVMDQIPEARQLLQKLNINRK